MRKAFLAVAALLSTALVSAETLPAVYVDKKSGNDFLVVKNANTQVLTTPNNEIVVIGFNNPKKLGKLQEDIESVQSCTFDTKKQTIKLENGKTLDTKSMNVLGKKEASK